MRHGLMYQGAFEPNRPRLARGTTTYLSTDGTLRPLPDWPAAVDGVRIGYMERTGKKFVAVRIQFEEHDVILGEPLPIDPMRHLGSRRLSPEPTFITDDLASHLLDDALHLNPGQEEELARLINRVNQVRRGSGPIG